MKDVLISIRGTQRTLYPGQGQEDETQTVELVTPGRFEYGPEQSWFTYEESELTGMDGTTTTFQLTPDRVMLLREGSFTSQMLFEPGRKSVFLYDTPYGSMTMGLDTSRLQSAVAAEGGRLDITYQVDLNSIPYTKNIFRIDWKVAESTKEGDTP